MYVNLPLFCLHIIEDFLGYTLRALWQFMRVWSWMISWLFHRAHQIYIFVYPPPGITHRAILVQFCSKPLDYSHVILLVQLDQLRWVTEAQATSFAFVWVTAGAQLCGSNSKMDWNESEVNIWRCQIGIKQKQDKSNLPNYQRSFPSLLNQSSRWLCRHCYQMAFIDRNTQNKLWHKGPLCPSRLEWFPLPVHTVQLLLHNLTGFCHDLSSTC